MTPMNDKKALETRAEEIRYLGTQFAMNGVTPPPELVVEYQTIQIALRALDIDED